MSAGYSSREESTWLAAPVLNSAAALPSSSWPMAARGCGHLLLGGSEWRLPLFAPVRTAAAAHGLSCPFLPRLPAAAAPDIHQQEHKEKEEEEDLLPTQVDACSHEDAQGQSAPPPASPAHYWALS